MSVFDLWLPILLAGLAVHVCCTIAWTALPHHKPEWTKLPAEDALLDFLDQHDVGPGQHIFPYAQDSAEMQSDSYKEKMQGKCKGMLVLWPKPPSMGQNIGLTLLFFIVTCFVIGYLASLALAPGASFMKVFQFVTTAGLLAFTAGQIPNAIWFRRKLLMDIIDSVVYAVVAGLIFASLWPGG